MRSDQIVNQYDHNHHQAAKWIELILKESEIEMKLKQLNDSV
jgi:hypothetical protein